MQKNILKIILLISLFVPFISNAAPEIWVKTESAINVTDAGATLRGMGYPDNVDGIVYPTVGYFRYSASPTKPIFCEDIYGSDIVSTQDIKITTEGQTFQQVVTDLDPDTTYYYCAILSGTRPGRLIQRIQNSEEVKQFRTLPCPDCAQIKVTTKTALNMTSNSATLKGTYNSTKPIKTYFEYRKYVSGNNFEISGATNTESQVETNTMSTKSMPISPTASYGNFFVSPSSVNSGAKKPMSWIKIAQSEKNRSANTAGDLNFFLSGLSPASRYEFRLVAETISNGTSKGSSVPSEIVTGNTLDFRTSPVNGGGGITDDSDDDNNGGGNGNGSGNGTGGGYILGQILTPPELAVVRSKEGIETVFVRQIMANNELAKTYGYVEGTDLETFAWNIADVIARAFGYVNPNTGKEIRVAKADIAAYELKMEDRKLTVYEYYDSKIVNIQTFSTIMRNSYYYEYYFRK